MHYRSTRSSSSSDTSPLLSFREAVLQGLAPDGGLYIPATPLSDLALPISTIFSPEWTSASFVDLAINVFKLFVGESDIPTSDLKVVLEKSFGTFRSKEVTPLVSLPGLDNGYILELFHGPTFAFKDVALQVVGNLFEYFLTHPPSKSSDNSTNTSQPTKIAVVGATSGDTGSAAIYGLRNKDNICVFILHPKGRISPIQEAQMTTVLDKNVHNIKLEGTFDDCQEIVKKLFGDDEFQKSLGSPEVKLGAVNSINWARILSQIVYYFYSYYRCLEKISGRMGAELSYYATHSTELPKIQYSVPTGNFGDVLAGYYAYRLGLPIHEFIIATNSNDVLKRFLETGTYSKTGADVKSTLSPAMDILVSSNFERLLWYAAREALFNGVENGDALAGEKLAEWMRDLKDVTKKSFTVDEKVLEFIRGKFSAVRVSDEETSRVIRGFYGMDERKKTQSLMSKMKSLLLGKRDSSGYLLDPHTAVGVSAALTKLKESKDSKDIHTICLATAHPGKFPDAIEPALNNNIRYEEYAPKELVDVKGKEKRYVEVKDIEEVKKIVLERVNLN